MKPSIEHIHRYLDGEIDAAAAADFERKLADDEGLRREVDDLRQLGSVLRENPAFDPVVDEVPHADFFNAHLLRQIEQERRIGRPLSDSRVADSGWFGWLRLPWLVAAGATAVAVFSVIQGGDSGEAVDTGRTLVVSTYAPDPAVRSAVWFADAAGATVIELSGIDEIPDEQIVTGRDLGSHEAGRGLAITLKDSSGTPVATLMPDMIDGTPSFRTLSVGKGS